VLDRHHVLCAKAQAAVGKTVKRPKPREVSVGLQVRELRDATFLGLVCGLARESEVANAGRGDTGLEFEFNDAQQERRLA
jgi:hypothetical protein